MIFDLNKKSFLAELEKIYNLKKIMFQSDQVVIKQSKI